VLKSSDSLAPEDGLCILIAERSDHTSRIQRDTLNGKQEVKEVPKLAILVVHGKIVRLHERSNDHDSKSNANLPSRPEFVARRDHAAIAQDALEQALADEWSFF
jgi:hypothetical protein